MQSKPNHNKNRTHDNLQAHSLKKTPPPALLLHPLALLPPPHGPLLPRLQLPQPLHLLEHELEPLLAPHDIEMAPDLGVLARKAVDFVLRETAAETRVQLAGQLVVEFGEEFSFEEEVSGGGELVGDGVEEDFGTVVFVLAGVALFGFDGEEAQAEEVDAVAEEDGFAAWGC